MTTIAPYPLQWPANRPRRKASSRRDAQFNIKERLADGYRTTRAVTVTESLKRLQKELDRIGARHPIVSSNLETRLDGFPRSNQPKVPDPGVAVYFQLSGKPHCLPCDTYTTVADNLAAVAAHIAATRAIERHGVASVQEMFSGFAALPAPKTWRDILGFSPGEGTRTMVENRFRELAAVHHPDRGGSHERMAEINRARDEALKEICA